MPRGAYMIDIRECIQHQAEYEAGSFCCSGKMSLPLLPDIAVDGVGQLSFPLPDAQCRQLMSAASRVSNGCGQIAAAAVHVDSSFQHALQSVTLPAVCEALGLKRRLQSVECRLSRLQLCTTGGPFSAARDSEKEDGMFGTLVLLLPSQYAGGQLLVEHARQRLTVDCSQGSDWRGFHYAAFFADCRHEIRPVTSGYRVALTYNLCLTRKAGNERGGGRGGAHLDRTVAADESEDEKQQTAKAGSDSESESEEEKGDSGRTEQLVSGPLPSASRLRRDVVQQLAAGFLSWHSEPLQRYRTKDFLVIPLHHRYDKHDIAVEQLKDADSRLMETIRAAISVAAEQRKRVSEVSASAASVSSPAPDPLASAAPVLPFFCILEHRIVDNQYGADGENDDDYMSAVLPVPLPHSLPAALQPGLNTYGRLLCERGEIAITRFEVLHTDPGFNWASQEPDSEQQEYGSRVSRVYRKSAILLVLTKQRWRVAALGPRALTLLKECTLDTRCDTRDCLRIATVACESWYHSAASMLTSLLAALAALNTRMQQEAAGSAASSSPSFARGAAAGSASSSSSSSSSLSSSSSSPSRCDAEVAALIAAVFKNFPLAVEAVSLPCELDWAAQQLDANVVVVNTVTAFIRHLKKTAHASSYKGPHSALSAAADFLTRFFTLEKKPSASSSSAAYGQTPPRYEGSTESVRAICLWVLHNPAFPSVYTFPAHLTSEKCAAVRRLATQVGGSRLSHWGGDIEGSAMTVARPREAGEGSESAYTLVALDGDTRLPARWTAAMHSMVSALQERIAHCQGKAALSSGRLLTALEFGLCFLNLLSAMHAQAAEADLAAEAEGWLKAASAVVSALVQRVETAWTSSKSDSDDLELQEAVVGIHIQRALLQQTLELLDSLGSGAFAAVCLPLARFVSRWLQEQLSAPAPVEWTYPTRLSLLVFPLVRGVDSGWLKLRCDGQCEVCRALRLFLQSPTQRSLDWRSAGKERDHAESVVDRLCNPHLSVETLRDQIPHTLRVTKKCALAGVHDKRKEKLRALLTRLDTAIARIETAPAAPAAHSAGRKRQRKEVVLVDDEEEKDEEEEGEKKQQQAPAGKRKGGKGQKGKKREEVQKEKVEEEDNDDDDEKQAQPPAAKTKAKAGRAQKTRMRTRSFK